LKDAAEAARAAMRRSTNVSRAPGLMLEGITERILDGVAAGAEMLRGALDGIWELARSDHSRVRRWMVPAFPILQESAAHELWDEKIVHQLSAAAVRHARDAGSLDVLPRALVYQAGSHVLA